jgi:dethiobiotin synthetase
MPVNTQNCPTIFITGTDTGVGKTMVAAALAKHLRESGLRIGVMKPFETGVTDIEEMGDDAKLLTWAAESVDPETWIAPYRFPDPLSPAQAAKIANESIDITRIEQAFSNLREGKDFVIVEGAGGLMVPIRGGFLMADLAKTLGTPTLVVSRPGLGTINHTLLTVMAARSMDVPLTGIIINRMPDAPGQAEADAPHALASLASAELLGVLPEVEGQQEVRVTRLSKALSESPTLPWLMKSLGLS